METNIKKDQLGITETCQEKCQWNDLLFAQISLIGSSKGPASRNWYWGVWRLLIGCEISVWKGFQKYLLTPITIIAVDAEI